jgi:hypothetical protein
VITDYDLAQLCAATYDPSVIWDHAWTAKDIHVVHKKCDGVDVIAFRGSQDMTDWERDFMGWPVKHPRLGWVHDGFILYADLIFEEIMAVVGHDVIFTGHSLGAARASDQAALFASHGAAPLHLAVFGEPRPGFEQLHNIIAKAIPTSVWYRNGSDPVTEVPALFGRYMHGPANSRSMTVEPERSSVITPVLPMEYHSIQLYVKGLSA